jgi:hypothetical protein
MDIKKGITKPGKIAKSIDVIVIILTIFLLSEMFYDWSRRLHDNYNILFMPYSLVILMISPSRYIVNYKLMTKTDRFFFILNFVFFIIFIISILFAMFYF